MMKFCQEIVNKIMSYKLSHFDIEWGGYIIGSIYTVFVEETGENAGEIKIISKKKIKNKFKKEMWRYNFIVERNKEEEELLKKRLEQLGYI